MKRLLMLLVVVIAACNAGAQQPVVWNATAKHIKGKIFEIRLKATISEGWYVYSQYMENKGPQPTSISYEGNCVDTNSRAIEVGKLQRKYDSQFGMEIAFFYNKVEFVQQVRVKQKLPLALTGSVVYMGCNAQMCMPPQEEKFEVILK
jgi:hypothetical protein